MIYYLTRYYILGSVYNISNLAPRGAKVNNTAKEKAARKHSKPPLYFCNNQMTESCSIIRA